MTSEYETDIMLRTDRVPAEAGADWQQRILISLIAGDNAFEKDDMKETIYGKICAR